MGMLYIHHFKISNIVLLFLMFTLIFLNMQMILFVFHTIGLKCNHVSLLYGYKFGSLE